MASHNYYRRCFTNLHSPPCTHIWAIISRLIWFRPRPREDIFSRPSFLSFCKASDYAQNRQVGDSTRQHGHSLHQGELMKERYGHILSHLLIKNSFTCINVWKQQTKRRSHIFLNTVNTREDQFCRLLPLLLMLPASCCTCTRLNPPLWLPLPSSSSLMEPEPDGISCHNRSPPRSAEPWRDREKIARVRVWRR